MKIVALADIQIRNNTREDEYRSVFSKLYYKLRELKPDRIVIAGDIFHHKSTLSPESVALAPEFFGALSDIAPLDVIPGNHDMGKDVKRLDAVASVVEKNMIHWVLTNPITYYGNENIYDIDDKHCYFMWDFRRKTHTRFEKPEGKIAIGLFHGAPYSMRLDSGEEMPPVIDESIFNNADYMICGDIHKREFWNNQKYVMVGSLICQNFGEEHYKHGFVMIDTDTEQVTEYEIQNDWGYFTITDEHVKIDAEGKAKVTAKIPFKQFSLRTRLYNEYTDTQLGQIKIDIKKKFKKDISITVFVNPKENVKDYSAVDLSNVNVQNGLIDEYCKENKISNVEKLKEINIEMNRRIKDTSDNLYNVKWSPLELRFKNIFAYGDVESVIDFTKLPGITAILGKNGTGKSSMFHAMLFLLFSKTPKISTQAEILNDRKDECWMQLTIKVENNIYRITKEFVKKRKNISSSLSFEKWNDVLKEFDTDDAEANDGKQDDKKDVKQTITKILGNYDDVLLSSFSLQNDFAKILESGESDRRNYLYNFLGVNIFNLLYKVSSKDESTHESVISQFTNVNFDEQIESNEMSINSYNTKITEAKNLKEKYKSSIVDVDNKINVKMSELGAYSEKVKQVSKMTEISNNISENKNIISNNNEMISRNKDTLHMHQLKLQQLQDVDIEFERNKIDSIINNNSIDSEKLDADYQLTEKEREDLDKRNKTSLELKEKINSLSNNITKLDTTIKNYERQSDILSKQSWMRTNEQCKLCQLAKDAFESDALLKTQTELRKRSEALKTKMQGDVEQELDSIIKSNSDKLKDITSKIKKINEENKTLLTSKENLQKIDNQLKELETDIEKTNINILSLQEKNKIYELELSKLQTEHQKLLALNEEVKKANILTAELKDLNQDKELNKGRIEKLDSVITDTTIQIGKLEQSIITLNEDKVKYNNAVEKAILYKTYRSIVNKDGLPFTVLQRFIPLFNRKISEYLTDDIANFNVRFEIVDDKLRVMMQKYGDIWRDIKSAGGMEFVVSSWVIRAVLSEFSILPKSDVFIIDEGFGAFDIDNIGNVEILFEKFKNRFGKIMVISHVPIIADFCDNLMEVVVDDNGYSHIGNV